MTPPAGEVRSEIRALRRRQALLWALGVRPDRPARLAVLRRLLPLRRRGDRRRARARGAAAGREPAGARGAAQPGAAETVELGGTVESRLVLHNRKGLPALWLFWRDAGRARARRRGGHCGFQTLTSEETMRSACTLHSTRRGLFRVGPAVIEASDPLRAGAAVPGRPGGALRHRAAAHGASGPGMAPGPPARPRGAPPPEPVRGPLPLPRRARLPRRGTACGASTGAPPPARAACR